jgi:pyridoxamine 5'-phosphate oxidase
VARDGTPRVRTLVFRGWAGAEGLDLLTDGRSAKGDQLAGRGAVELCWLLPRARCQFRLRGHRQRLAPEVDRHERQRHWQALSPAGRAVWAWPPPGLPLQPEAPFPAELVDGTAMPEHLLLLRLAITQVELLELGPHPHRRRRWLSSNGWCEELLNP